jgi:hypothetical protein
LACASATFRFPRLLLSRDAISCSASCRLRVSGSAGAWC